MRERFARALSFSGIGFGALLCAAAPIRLEAQPAPTFTKDVAPIVFANCASCHRPGQMAPMSLLTYEDARPYARAIRAKVTSGEMPPWHADAPPGVFLNDRRLSDHDRDILAQWANGGAPKGDDRDLPPAPVFAEGWELGNPDMVISMPAPFEVPASGTIEYQYIEAPTNFSEDKWVQAIEVRPGARSVVHHVLVFARDPNMPTRPSPFTQVVPPPAPPKPTAGPPTPRPKTPNRGALIATTAPGTNALTFAPGTALLLKAGTVLTFQVHYTANGAPTNDRSSVGLIFAKQPPLQEVRTSAFLNSQLKLAPGGSDQAVDAAIEFKEDVHISAIFPHTHLRGKQWSYTLVYPDGRSEAVLSVPKYDFNWQTYYIFARPLAVPKGARLEATAIYDNSAANRANPDPTKEVHWGEQTWEEMQYTGLTFTVDSAAVSTRQAAPNK
jgi:mono/diheme cytochrome c family protein